MEYQKIEITYFKEDSWGFNMSMNKDLTEAMALRA